MNTRNPISNLATVAGATPRPTATSVVMRHASRSTAALVIAATAAVFMTACASTPPPTAEMAVSTAAVANAVSAGAGELAPVEMQAARSKLDSAKAAMSSKDYAQARTLADEALVDAQLAEAKARAGKAQQAADALTESSRVLRQELERKVK